MNVNATYPLHLHRALALVALTLGWTACADDDGDAAATTEDTEASTMGAATPTTSTTSDSPSTGEDDMLPCVDVDIGMAVGTDVVAGFELGEEDRFALEACEFASDARNPEFVVAWTSPSTRDYVIDSRPSGFDTVLSVTAAECTASPRVYACNDDCGDDFGSALTYSARGGETVFIVIENFSQSAGEPVVLDIQAADGSLDCSFGFDSSSTGFGDTTGGFGDTTTF